MSCCCQAQTPAVTPTLYVSKWAACWQEVTCTSETQGEPNKCGLSKVWNCSWQAVPQIDRDIYDQFYPPNAADLGQTTPPNCSCVGGCGARRTPQSQNLCAQQPADIAPPPDTYWWQIPTYTYSVPSATANNCVPCQPQITSTGVTWLPAIRKPCIQAVQPPPPFLTL
jgi:hypothetical protein